MIWVEQAIPVYKLTPKLPEKKKEERHVSFKVRLDTEIGRLKRDAIQEKKL